MNQLLPDYMIVTRDFYETNAARYAATTAGMIDEEWLNRFVSLLPHGANVLDVGCSSGRDAAWFQSHGSRAVGVDIAPTFIEMARRSVPAGEFHVMSVTSLQFENSSFDGVWCSCVLIHLSKKDTAVAIGEMFRVLKPGGVLYILVKAGESEGYEADSRYEGMKKYSSYFTEDELRHLLEGFQIISVTSVDKPVDLYRAPDRIFVLARKPQV